MRITIKEIKENIKDNERNIYGWEMRIMQCKENVFGINKRLDEYETILEQLKANSIELKTLLKNRQGVEKGDKK